MTCPRATSRRSRVDVFFHRHETTKRRASQRQPMQRHNSKTSLLLKCPHSIPSSVPANCSSCLIPLHAPSSSSIPCPPLAVRASSRPPSRPDTSQQGHSQSRWPCPALLGIVSWIISKRRGLSAIQPYISRHGSRAVASRDIIVDFRLGTKDVFHGSEFELQLQYAVNISQRQLPPRSYAKQVTADLKCQ